MVAKRIESPRSSVVAPGFTAVIQRDGDWWIGWVEEIRGVQSQGETREELIENLKSALEEAIEINRERALAHAVGQYEEVSIPR